VDEARRPSRLTDLIHRKDARSRGRRLEGASTDSGGETLKRAAHEVSGSRGVGRGTTVAPPTNPPLEGGGLPTDPARIPSCTLDRIAGS
jgi:hypothetical protein